MGRNRLAALIAAGLVVGVAIGIAIVPGARQKLLPENGLKTIGQATVGGPFNLIDQNGRRVTDQDFRGRFMLIYFGFTHCPDFCPSALQVMSAALDKLGAKADRVTPILISVDPKRDTVEQLKSYVSSFHPRLVGLTGTPEEIASVAKAYRVYFKEVADPKSTAGYTVDHSSIIYLMGPDGKFLTHFTHATPVDTVIAGLAKRL